MVGVFSSSGISFFPFLPFFFSVGFVFENNLEVFFCRVFLSESCSLREVLEL
jgi:hypothetical protein